MKKFLIPVVAGVVVFGGVTAFAATLNVSSSTLSAGNAVVNTCNADAHVTYTPSLATSGTNKGKYVVSTTPVTTGPAPTSGANPCAGMSFKVTLLDAADVSLGEKNGTLDSSGVASPDFTTLDIPAAAVRGVAVVITG